MTGIDPTRAVIVTGSRNWADRARVWEALTEAQPSIVVQGGATGADFDAVQWAKMHGVPYLTVPPRWREEGRSAGPLRNIRMLQMFPRAHVLAFPEGKSRGTRHCMREAAKRGMRVVDCGAG